MQWAIRVGLTSTDEIDPLEPARPGGRRGVKLKASFTHVAQEIATGRK
jgi:hypothetical protein